MWWGYQSTGGYSREPVFYASSTDSTRKYYEKLDFVSRYLKGRSNLSELMNLPFKVFHNFYRLAILDNEAKAKNQSNGSLSDIAEAIEDEM